MHHFYYFVNIDALLKHIQKMCNCSKIAMCDFFSTLKRVDVLRSHGVVKGLIGVVSAMDAIPSNDQESSFKTAQNFLVNFFQIQNIPFLPLSSLTEDNLFKSTFSWFQGFSDLIHV